MENEPMIDTAWGEEPREKVRARIWRQAMQTQRALSQAEHIKHLDEMIAEVVRTWRECVEFTDPAEFYDALVKAQMSFKIDSLKYAQALAAKKWIDEVKSRQPDLWAPDR